MQIAASLSSQLLSSSSQHNHPANMDANDSVIPYQLCGFCQQVAVV